MTIVESDGTVMMSEVGNEVTAVAGTTTGLETEAGIVY
jgi:hypothetical protein